MVYFKLSLCGSIKHSEIVDRPRLPSRLGGSLERLSDLDWTPTFLTAEWSG